MRERISFAFAFSIVAMMLPALLFAQNDSAANSFSDADLEFFEAKVRPILVERCYECHGPESDREGDLSLASRQDMLTGGDSGPSLVAHKPGDSLLIETINYEGVYEMPPSSKLPDEEIEILTKWVKLGAPWPAESDLASASAKTFDLAARKAEHWCWQPRKTPAPPELDADSWSQKPLDHFVLKQLRDNKLTPNESADKRTLIRRAYFDITGLPPTPAQIEAFEKDDSPNAFEKVVDHALASPRFGEHWARHWMDLTRFAETGGHEFDYPIPDAWKYRDYLIRAFNEDVHYDQFIREHIAGDLLESPRRHKTEQYNESVIGTGFWHLHEAVHGPTDVRADRADHVDNQIDVMTKSFLGLTVACARCHDHKFDAISTEDYYAMFGFLKSSRRQRVMLDRNNQIAEAAKKSQSLRLALREAELEVMKQIASSDVKQIADHAAFAVRFLSENSSLTQTPATKIVTKDLRATAPTGIVEEQTIPKRENFNWENDTQFWWRDGKLGDEFTFEINAAQLPGMVGRECELFANYTLANDYGRAKLSFNGEVINPEIDFYSVDLRSSNRTSLGKVTIKKGLNKLQFTVLEPNEKAIPRNMIGIDYFEFAAMKAAPDQIQQEIAGSIEKNSKLELNFLKQLSQALMGNEIRNPTHPLFALHKMQSNSDWHASTLQEIKNQKAAFVKRKKKEPPTKIFADFRNGIPEDWITAGQAFGDVNNGKTDPIASKRGEVRSDRLGNKYCGVLYSPTFTIKHDKIFYRAQGKNCKIRLIIDGFVMDVYNGLLFKGCSFDLNEPKMKWIVKAGDIKNYIGHQAHIEIIDHGDGGFGLEEIRFGNGSPPAAPPTTLERFAKSIKGKTTEIACRKLFTQLFESASQPDEVRLRHELVNFFIDNNMMRHLPQPDSGPLNMAPFENLKQIRKQFAAANQAVPRPSFVPGLIDGDGLDEQIYIRGNHKTLGQTAKRNFLTALSPTPLEIEKGSGRKQLAEQIASADNPLTARVAVNRVWHHMLGVGIVPSVDNFGALGQAPSHPELLDYLANEFVDDQWSIKKMIRRIALSKTYQLSSKANLANSTTDPNNKSLHRANVKRLTGESIRDTILAVSGKLKDKQLGPPVKVHLTSFMQGRGRPGKSGPLDGDGRRSIYLEVRRNFLSPMMLAFDTPIPFNTIGRRNQSNVPAQALILMNSPFVIDQASHWAKAITESADQDRERINAMYLQAFGRPVTDVEFEEATSFIKAQLAESNAETAWSDYCHILFNTKEFIYIK